jgi:ankyrin repeat protein
MVTLPLPPRPNLTQYKKLAKDLVVAANSDEPNALHDWAMAWFHRLAKLVGIEFASFEQETLDRMIGQFQTHVARKIAKEPYTLSDAQWMLARAHDFQTWTEFAGHLEHPFKGPAEGREFDAAADAIVSGNVPTLMSLLRENPKLVSARSSRKHRATLLHYVAANGVEDWRQKTPASAVEIARALLTSGADVDALAETYGGGKAQTTMNLLVSSAHPHGAGLQSALVEVLLDHGAAINGLEDDGSPIMTALAFWYGDAAVTLAKRGARVDNAVAAAGIGRLDLVKVLVVDRETLSPAAKSGVTKWFSPPREPKAHIECAFVAACHFNRGAVADWFLELDVDIRAVDKDKMTALHWAGANGNIALATRLLDMGAPLEAKNQWGGTVLDSTGYFAAHMPVKGVDYLPIMQFLVARGADPGVLKPYPSGNPVVDEIRRISGLPA